MIWKREGRSTTKVIATAVAITTTAARRVQMVLCEAKLHLIGSAAKNRRVVAVLQALHLVAGQVAAAVDSAID